MTVQADDPDKTSGLSHLPVDPKDKEPETEFHPGFSADDATACSSRCVKIPPPPSASEKASSVRPAGASDETSPPACGAASSPAGGSGRSAAFARVRRTGACARRTRSSTARASSNRWRDRRRHRRPSGPQGAHASRPPPPLPQRRRRTRPHDSSVTIADSAERDGSIARRSPSRVAAGERSAGEAGEHGHGRAGAVDKHLDEIHDRSVAPRGRARRTTRAKRDAIEGPRPPHDRTHHDDRDGGPQLSDRSEHRRREGRRVRRPHRATRRSAAARAGCVRRR